MTFTAPLGLLALLAVPAVLALHLFRNKLPQRRIAALFLFPPQALVAGAGRTRTRLLRTPSLWLELLAALLLGLWLGGLSFGGIVARHVVVVLDDSASMTAGAQQRGLVDLRSRLSALSASDFVSVLRTGERSEVLVGPRARPGEAVAALVRWRPRQPRHPMAPALDLARELALGGGQVWFLTDEELPPGSDDVTLLAHGVAAPNAAILTAERTPRATGEGEQLRARFGAFGGLGSTELVLFAGDRELLRQSIEFRDGLADVVVPLPAELDVLRLQLRADALPIDDEAWLLPVPRRVVGLCNQLPADHTAALAIDRLRAALPDVQDEPDSRRAQLLLRSAPGVVGQGQLEVVVAAGPGERLAFTGPYVIDRAHPFCAGLALQGVAWVTPKQELPGRTLIAAGAQALASDEALDAGRRLWLALEPLLGNVARAPDWPVLATNLVESCRAEVPGALAVQVPLGGEARYRRALPGAGPDVPDGVDAKLALVAPDGTRAPAPASAERTVGWLLREPGVHTLFGRDDRPLARFGARFLDAAESDLRLLVTRTRDAQDNVGEARRSAARDTGWERRVLALLLLLCVLADWWVLARRDVA